MLATSTLNGYGSLQSNNLTLSVLQPQANGLVRTLASVILQRTPRTKNARSGLPQDEQSKEIKNSKRNSQAVTQIKVAKDQPSQRSHELQTKFQSDAILLRLPLTYDRGILSIYNLLQATSQLIGSVVLLIRIVWDGLNQGIINGNPMPHKDDKGRGRTSHHTLRNQLHHMLPIRAERSNLSAQAIRHLCTLRHKVLVRKTHKIGSPGADVLDHCNNICNSIYNTLENPRPRRSSLHRLHTYSSCTKQRNVIKGK